MGGLIPRATPWEHLQLPPRLRAMPDGWQDRARDLLDRFDLGGVDGPGHGGFSHGMGRRLSVVLAAFHSPDVLLLDEPFDGVDPLGVDATLEVIRELRLGGSAVLVSTHLLELAVQACDEAVVLRRGAVVAAAPSTELAGVAGRRSLPVAAVVSTSQLVPLLALRWRMVRSPQARWGFALLASALPLLCLAAVVVGLLAPRERILDVACWPRRPTCRWRCSRSSRRWPPEAATSSSRPSSSWRTPSAARTQYLASLVLTPLNLAWATQLVALVGLTAYVSGPSAQAPLALLTCLAYVAFVTIAGQALAWVVVGARQHVAGRRLTWVTAGLAAAACVAVVATGSVTAVLDRSPTTTIVLGAQAAPQGDYLRWSVTTAALLLAALGADRLGRWLCAWSLRRPGDVGSRIDSRPVRRRAAAGSQRRELLATDRASVWRSASLRRGLIVLGIVPGLVATLARLEWSALVLLPGLVAAGAGLLFGVNAFCLDGTGAVWLASLPVRARTVFWTKGQVVAETCALAVVVTVAAGSLRAERPPTAGEAAALASCAVVVVLRVLATCMDLSVTRPYRADLSGPRDTPAPPGVMAAYSARLAVSTTLVAVLFSTLAEVATWWWPVLIAAPFCLLSLRHLLRSARYFDDVDARARVVATVVSG